MADNPEGNSGAIPITVLIATATALVLLALIVWYPRQWLRFQLILSALLVTFIPGYLLLAALMPRAPTNAQGRSLDRIERIVLAVGLSISLLVVIGVVLGMSPWGITRSTVLVTLSVMSIAFGVVGIDQWFQLVPADRFTVVAYDTDWNDLPTTLEISNVILLVCIIVAVATFAFALAAPQPVPGFTEFTVMAENEDGELETTALPTELGVDEPMNVVVEIANRERSTVSYTLIVMAEDLDGTGANATVDHADEIDRIEVELEHGEDWVTTVDAAVDEPGEDTRISLLLYDETVAFFPDQANADYSVHFWVDVLAPGEQESS